MPILDDDVLDDPEVSDLPPETVVTDTDWSWLPGVGTKPSRRLFGRSDKEPPKRTPGRKKNLTEPLANQITWLGTGVTFMRPITGIAIIDKADDVAAALNELAKANPRLYAVLEKLVSGNEWGKLVTACMPIAAAAFVESQPNSGFLSLQAVNIMERGLSEKALEQIEKHLPE
jgi:hypothetical protein